MKWLWRLLYGILLALDCVCTAIIVVLQVIKALVETGMFAIADERFEGPDRGRA